MTNDKHALCLSCSVSRRLAWKNKIKKEYINAEGERVFLFFSFLKSQRAKCARTRQMVGKNRKDLFTFPPLFGWRGIH